MLKGNSVWKKMAFAALFGKRKTPEELLRQNQRALTKVRLLTTLRYGASYEV